MRERAIVIDLDGMDSAWRDRAACAVNYCDDRLKPLSLSEVLQN